MFAMMEYPPDMLPLYSQGYSLARFLIAQGGRRKFVTYVEDGLVTNDWTSATAKHYEFSSLSDLQLTWKDWVQAGSPELQPRRQPEQTLLASRTQPAAPPRSQSIARPASSWYAKTA